MLSIPNATVVLSSLGTNYRITPNEGYVLHDKSYDFPILDEETREEIGTQLGYRTSMASIHINSDLSERTILDENGNEVTAYTSREFFCKLRTEVPENQIFGVDEPEHEIM